MPLPGDNVTVNRSWTLIMDVQPAPIDHLKVDGDVIISENLGNVKITANSIWIGNGSIKAGDESTPYPGNLTF